MEMIQQYIIPGRMIKANFLFTVLIIGYFIMLHPFSAFGYGKVKHPIFPKGISEKQSLEDAIKSVKTIMKIVESRMSQSSSRRKSIRYARLRVSKGRK